MLALAPAFVRIPFGPSRDRRAWAVLAVLALVASLFAVAVFHAPKAKAAPVQAFQSAFHTQDNGQIGLFGNSVMTCPTTATGCTAAKAATPTTAAQSTVNNNDFAMTYVKADTSVSGLTNSSSSDVVLPAQSTVLWAGLYWGGRTTAGTGGTATTLSKANMKLRVPGSATYSTITADTTYDAGDGTTYGSFTNVTTAVKAAGAGTYWGADVAASTGQDRFGGWSLIVVYRSPSLPLRDLTVNNGYEYIAANSAGDSFSFSGFLTPPSGTVRSRVGVLSWEGDAGFVGDSMSLNGTALSSSLSPAGNFFDSSNDLLGANVTTRSPNDQNMFGMDVKDIAAPNALANNTRSATVALKTDGDAYYPQAITTTIDLYAPNFSSLVKSVKDLSGNSPAAAGDILQYTLSYTNSGDDAADDSVVKDALPAGLTFVPGSLTVSNAGAAAVAQSDATGDDLAEFTGGSVVARVGTGSSKTAAGTLEAVGSAPANTATVTFKARINRTAAGSTINNTSTLDYTAHTIAKPYTFTGNTVSTPVAALADLAVTGSATPAPVAAGQQLTYQFQVANNGPNDAAGSVLTTTIPDTLTNPSATWGTNNACTIGAASGGVRTVTCSIGAIANAATVPVTIVGTVPSGASTGSLAATATVSATTADDVNSNNIASVSSTVTQQADVAVTHTGPAGAVIPGNDATYTIAVTNNGPSDASATTLTDTLPNNLTFKSAAASNGVTCTQSNGVISCPFGTVASGASRTVTVIATVNPGATGGSTITPVASVTSTTSDPNTGNNQAGAPTTVGAPTADVGISGNPTPATAVPGTNQQIGYTVTNNGPSTATNVIATVAVPAGTTYVGITSRTGSCTYDAANRVATCNLGTLASKATSAILLQTTVDANRTAALSGTASVTTTANDTVNGNDSTTVPIPVAPSADLDVNVVGDRTPLTAGQQETYTITAKNNGPSDTSQVQITNAIPQNTTFSSSDAATSNTTYDPATGIWDIGAIPVGQTATLHLVVTANSSTSTNSTIVDTASVTRSSAADPVSGNNSGTYTVSTNTVADVQVTGSADPSTVTAGSSTTLTFPVTNNGPSDAAGVTFTYVLPAGTSYGTVSGQTGASCSYDNASRTVSCTIGTLASGATNQITVTIGINANTAPGPLTNTATVATTTSESTTSNNSAAVVLTVTTAADLGIRQVLDPMSVDAGTSFTDTVTVTNAGPSSASLPRLKVTPPAGFVFGTPTSLPSGASCTTPGGVLTCVLATIDPNATPMIVVPVTVDPMVAPGNYPLAAQVSTTTSEPDPDTAHPDTASSSVAVTATAGLGVTTAVAPSPAANGQTNLVPGQQATQAVAVRNYGPSDSQGVTVTIPVPDGTSVASINTPQGTCSLNAGRTQITCQLNTVSPTTIGATDTPLTIDVTYNVTSSATGSLSFSAAVSATTSQGTDNHPDSASASIGTSPLSDVGVRATVTDANPIAGSGDTYNFTVTNTGPSDAKNVVLSGNLPTGLSPAGLNAPSGVTCDQTQLPHISCTIATLTAGTSLTGSLKVVLSPSLTKGTVISNPVTVTTDTPDSNSANNRDSVDITVDTRAQLQIRQQALPPTSVVPGAPYVYRISLGNDGPSDALGVVLTDTLPADVTATSVKYTQGGTDYTCTINNTNHTFSCNIGTLPSGSVVVTVAGVVLKADSTAVTVNNVVSATTTTAAPTGGSQTVTSSLEKPVTPAAEVNLVKTAGSSSVAAGNTISWTITATNTTGPSVVRNLTVTDDVFGDPDYMPANPETGAPAVVPADMPALVNVSAVSDTGGTCTTAQSPDQFTSVSCPVGTLVVGQTATITLTATVSPNYPKSSIVNTAHMSTTKAANGQAAAFLSNGPDSNTSTVGVVASKDLSVAVNPATNPVVPGRPASYTVTVNNGGPSDSPNTVVTIPVPGVFGQVTVTDGAGDPVSCTSSADGLLCPVGTLTKNSPVTLTVTGTVDPAATGTVTEAASVPTTDDPTPGNNSASRVVALQPTADLIVTKTVDPSTPVVAGGDAMYVVTVHNDGPSVAHSITVTDTVQDGVTPTAATVTGGGTCTVNGQDVSCPVSSLAVGADATATITVRFPSSFDGATYSNAATATMASDTDPNPGNSTGRASGPSATSADLSTAIVTTPQAPGSGTVATPGNTVTYRVTAHNGGPSDAAAPQVIITLGADETLSGPATAPAGWTCTGTTTIRCTKTAAMGTGAGTDAVFTVVAKLDPAATAAQTMTSNIVSSTADPDGDNNGKTSRVTLTPAADLAVDKEVQPGKPISAGKTGGYVITVTNNGPSVAHATTVTDTLQTGVTPGQATITGTGNSCGTAGQTVTCTIPTIAEGGSTVTITIPVQVATNFNGAAYSNSAVASSADDTSTGNNTGTATGTAASEADLSTTVTAAPQAPGTTTPAVAVPGKQVTYTVTAHNDGPSDSSGTSVTITLPPGETLASVTPPTGWTCTGAATLTCTLPAGASLASGDDAVFTVVANVDPAATADQTLTATSASSGSTDPTPGNNNGSAKVSLQPHADLVTTKTIDPNPPTAGSDATYTVTVRNPNGPSVAHAITIADTLQPGVSARPGVAVTGGSCTVTGQAVSCSVASLAVGDTATLTLPVHFASNFNASAYSNSAVATMASDTDDNAANNTGSASGTAATDADLSTTVKATPQAPGSGTTAVPGRQVTYTVTTHNAGPSDALSPSVTITLAAGETLVGTVQAPAGWTCTGSGPITCSSTDPLAANGDAEFTVVTTVDPAATADQTVTAISSSPTDTTTGNNSGSATVSLAPRANLSVTKTVTPTTPIAGQDATYTVAVHNDGPSDAANITVTDAVQTGQQIQGTPTIVGGTCTVADQTVTCTLTSLASQATAEASITVHLPASFDPTTFTNTATATSSSTPDPDTSNNTGAVGGAAAAKADLQVTKTASSPVVAGGSVTWTVTVHNAGPSDATNVVVTDPLPDTVTPSGVRLTGDGVDGTCTSGSTVRCEIGRLPSDGTSTVVITATLASGATGTLTNTAAATAADQSDGNTGDNTASSSSPIGTATKLTLTKSVSPKALVAGEDATYTITATNSGKSDAVDVKVNDPLADGLEYRSVSTDPDGTPCNRDDGVTCTFDRIVPGQTTRMIVVVHVADDFDDPTLTNTASASSPSVPPTAPPTTTVTSPVVGPSTIDVTKTVDHPKAGVGDQVTFTVTASNDGSADVRPVVVDDRPPAGMRIDSVRASAGGYDAVTGRWTIPGLAAGASAVLHMTVTLQAAGTRVNVATVDPATPGVTTSTADSARAGVDVGSGNGGLAYTGVAVLSDVLLGVLLLGLGVAFIAGGRRRRSARHRA